MVTNTTKLLKTLSLCSVAFPTVRTVMIMVKWWCRCLTPCAHWSPWGWNGHGRCISSWRNRRREKIWFKRSLLLLLVLFLPIIHMLLYKPFCFFPSYLHPIPYPYPTLHPHHWNCICTNVFYCIVYFAYCCYYHDSERANLQTQYHNLHAEVSRAKWVENSK